MISVLKEGHVQGISPTVREPVDGGLLLVSCVEHVVRRHCSENKGRGQSSAESNHKRGLRGLPHSEGAVCLAKGREEGSKRARKEGRGGRQGEGVEKGGRGSEGVRGFSWSWQLTEHALELDPPLPVNTLDLLVQLQPKKTSATSHPTTSTWH